MCGFVISISRDEPVSAERAARALAALRHRGPDDSGSAVLRDGRVHLGHRRLAIQDLTRAGHQPMQLDRLWVVFNGEIYNFPELRRELAQRGCVFRTQCDTEVLLHGYRIWGREIPRHLAGMFAFGIWDDETGELFAARDHAGQKPFYYIAAGNRFLAASEPKALFALLGGRPKMRREAAKEFLIYEDIPEPFTWYEDLLALPPGQALAIATDRPQWAPAVYPYWDFVPPEKPVAIPARAARHRLGEILSRSVRMHQLADVEVGAFLSGGLDSSAVVALEARQRSGPVRTFSIGYRGEAGELPLARQIADMYACVHTETLLGEDGLERAFARTLDLFDMPFGDPSQFPTYEVAGLAAAHLKVVLTGDGGDEVFGGYWKLGRYMGSPPLDTSSLFELAYGLKHWRELRRQWRASYNFGHCHASNSVADALLGPEFADLKEYDGWWFYKQHWRPELDPFRRAQWLDFKTYLPSVLKKVDRCTMAHSLEARCPLLLPELVEWAFALPTRVKNPRGEFKHLYRAWLRRQRLLPRAVFDAPKTGFGLAAAVKSRTGDFHALDEAVGAARRAGWVAADVSARTERNWDLRWRLALMGQAVLRGYF